MNRTKSFLVAAGLSLAMALTFSCSSDGNDDDDVGGDSSSSGGGGSSDSNGEGEKQQKSILLYMTGDFHASKGELRWMETNATSLVNEAIEFGDDSRVFANNGKIFVVDRSTNKLHCIAPERLTMGDENAASEQSLEANANPYDIAFIGDKGYIAMYDLNYVQVFNVNTCALGNKINLPTGATHAASIKANGTTLYVIAQRLNGWTADKPGLLVRINANTGAKIDEIELKLWNPHSSVLSNEKLYVSSVGVYVEDNTYFENYPASNKNGIEVVNLAAGTSSVLKDGTALGGAASFLALDEVNQILYATIYDYDNFEEPVIPIDLSDGTPGNSLPDIEHSDFWGNGGLFFDDEDKKLYVGHASNPSGLKIYNPATKKTIDVGGTSAPTLPPYGGMAIVRF